MNESGSAGSVGGDWLHHMAVNIDPNELARNQPMVIGKLNKINKWHPCRWLINAIYLDIWAVDDELCSLPANTTYGGIHVLYPL